MNQTFCVKTH